MRDKYIVLLITSLIGFFSFSDASFLFKVIVKFPFATTHIDTTGNWVTDSVVRGREIRVIIHRNGDSLTQETKTNGLGEAYFSFDYWRDGIPADSSNIERMDFFFPHTERVIRTGAEINFEPLWIRDVKLENIREGINIILPFSIVWYEYDIGYGPFQYCFAVMPDMHIADGKKTQLHYIGGEPVYLEDFGSAGYDDTDNDPNETTFAIQNNENIVAKVNQLIGPGYNYPIKFVVCLGDITKSSERSEYERAKKILRNLQAPWIPVFGNHDTWPYIGRRWNYI